MTFQEKMQRIGAVALFLGLLGMFGVVGGIENLPPEATATQWISLAGAGAVSAMLMLFGISLIKE